MRWLGLGHNHLIYGSLLWERGIFITLLGRRKPKRRGELSEPEDVRRIKELHTMAILARRNVVGVRVGDKVKGWTTTGERSLVALVRR